MTRAVQRAIDLLEALKAAGRPVALSELAAMAHLDKATALRLVNDLAERHLVEMDSRTKSYSLGWGLAELAGGVWNRDSLPQVALRHLEELRDRSLQTVELCTRAGPRYVVSLELPGLQPIKYARGVGTSLPLTDGAAGRAILAHDPATGDDAVSPPSLRRELDRIRLSGFAYVEEADGSLSASLAAPILGRNGSAEAAVCLLWVATAGSESWERYRTLVMSCARRISRLRGGVESRSRFTG